MKSILPEIIGNIVIQLAQSQDENEMLKEQVKRLEQELAKASLVQNK